MANLFSFHSRLSQVILATSPDLVYVSQPDNVNGTEFTTIMFSTSQKTKCLSWQGIKTHVDVATMQQWHNEPKYSLSANPLLSHTGSEPMGHLYTSHKN